MRLAIIGGGAAGFFLAVNVKRMAPGLDVTIFEKRRRVLAKVEVSGGGRCNCTNTFAEVTDLKQVYPRGATLLKRLFKRFGPRDAYRWFETHGVPLTVQTDQCVFPQAQDSHAIINCFLGEARRLGVRVVTNTPVDNPHELLTAAGAWGEPFDFVAVTIGGTPKGDGCVPSLFSFTIRDEALHALMGTVVDNAIAGIPGTRFRAQGAILVTHWGMSGPAILKLSSHAARHLAEHDYQAPLIVNWTGETNSETVRQHLAALMHDNARKDIESLRPYGLPARLWSRLVEKAGTQKTRCAEVSHKGMNRLVETLTADTYAIASRCQTRNEFVTCGGVPLDTVDKNTLESRHTPSLYYAGEVLDIDGVTGGFNFQAAWTTAYTVAEAIAGRCLACASRDR